MVYNFKARFAPLVESGKKVTTIRAPRRDDKLPKPGETLKLFTGMRTKSCRKLGEWKCKRVTPILIIEVLGRSSGAKLGLVDLSPKALDDLAVRDGFEDWKELIAFFKEVHKLPFYGYLIEWWPTKQS